MAFQRRSGSSWITPSRIQRRSGSSWVDVQTIRRRSGNSWITVYSALSATASPDSHIWTANGDSPTGHVSTPGTSTVSVSGGSGTLTYTWERVSGSSSVSAGSPNQPSTYFHAADISGTHEAVFRCRVSDGTTTVYTNNVTVVLTYWYNPGGV